MRAFENSGALLIKLAQWGSSRPDMFGERGCRRFLHLQDNTPAHTWSHTERALDSMFGPEWRQELELERTPIGSGCIAQVYRGRLRVRPRVAAALAPCEDEWRPVAVKVLHPRVGEHVATDMRLLAAFGEMLMLSSLRWLNPTAMLAEFAASLTVQLDLTVEASNLDTFRSNFGVDRPSAGGAASRAVGLERSRPLVTFPEPLAPYISRDVLVESFVDGRPFLQWARQLPTDSPERQRICNEGIDAFIQVCARASSARARRPPLATPTSPQPSADPRVPSFRCSSSTTSCTATFIRATSLSSKLLPESRARRSSASSTPASPSSTRRRSTST